MDVFDNPSNAILDFIQSADIYSVSVVYYRVSIIFLTLDQISDKNHLKEEGLGSWFKETFRHCGDLSVGMDQDCRQKHKTVYSHLCGSGSKGNADPGLPLSLFRFVQSKTPVHETVLPTLT